MPERKALWPAGDAIAGLTAYPDDEAVLRRRLASAPVDVHSFRRPLKRCDIAHCQGMCCHDGVYVSEASPGGTQASSPAWAQTYPTG
jgi:hypothetical protein